ncbi:low molecular weight protein-tyrosine-phosphatase [Dysosmobacter welbionis]|mgnify:FL=1|uniref:low molecular weight protein-tyrosine-phosphatase n=1 Tax=Dysosmobacter welbionis TaxID=2093857 RepID=UPI003A910D15
MTKILFVCHGNICRSPMAEFVMKDLVKKAGLTSQFQIASAATSREEIGNPVYPPARRKLAEHGISCAGKTARQLTRADYGAYDLLIGMDQANLRNMRRICGGDPEGKIHLLLEYADRSGQEVADPWYTGDFEATWQDVLAGCQGLLASLYIL